MEVLTESFLTSMCNLNELFQEICGKRYTNSTDRSAFAAIHSEIMNKFQAVLDFKGSVAHPIEQVNTQTDVEQEPLLKAIQLLTNRIEVMQTINESHFASLKKIVHESFDNLAPQNCTPNRSDTSDLQTMKIKPDNDGLTYAKMLGPPANENRQYTISPVTRDLIIPLSQKSTRQAPTIGTSEMASTKIVVRTVRRRILVSFFDKNMSADGIIKMIGKQEFSFSCIKIATRNAD